MATREQMGIMEKRPERAFAFDERDMSAAGNGGQTNTDIGRLFTTGGIEKGQALHSILLIM